MTILDTLQLTYIPNNYWNEKFSGFSLTSKKQSLPQNVSFFLVWIPLNQSEQELNKKIKRNFPNIPAEKLLTCKIRLALPLNSDNSHFGIKLILGKIMPIQPAIKLLYQLQIFRSQDRSIFFSNSIISWAFLTKFLFELLNRGNFIPVLEPSKDLYNGQWKILLKTEHDNYRFKTILNNCHWTAYNLPNNFIAIEKNQYKTDSLWQKTYIFIDFMNAVGDSLIRSILNKPNFRLFKEIYSSEIKKENSQVPIIDWEYKLFKSLINKDHGFKVQRFSETIIPHIINNWSRIAEGFAGKRGCSLALKLNYPQNSEEDWPLNIYILLQEKNKLIPLNEVWMGKKSVLKELNTYFNEEEQLLEVILRSLGKIIKIFPPIVRVLEEQNPQEIKLNVSEVMDFLRYPKDLLVQSGINVLLPEGFIQGGKQRLSARLIIKSKALDKKKEAKGTSSNLPSIFDMNSMLEYKWVADLEGTTLTQEEFNELIETEEPLINWRGQWVLVDQQDITELRSIYKRNEDSGTKSYMEALKLGLSGNVQLQEEGNSYEVVVEGDLSEIIGRIKSIESFEDIPCPPSFNGVLRPYQQTALNWMGNMCLFNFGLCLADDMGLGKTIQVIALLLHLKEKYPNKPGSILIVCPTSVLFNWMREIKKFAPNLDVILHHGPGRLKSASSIPEYTKSHRIIITSYGTIRNDIDLFETIIFSGVILDESQNIKNYASQQTKAINRLQSQFRICLSGTPIENRLVELWSLFNFLNPGLLSNSRAEFQRKYVVPIERFQDQEAIENLKLIISPFTLRRVKSDKSIISDLPKKNEIKLFIDLSNEQAMLYKEHVEKTLKEMEIASTDKKKKSNLILGLLVKLKQICNHPNHFHKIEEIGEDTKKFISQSKKIKRLIEMVEEIVSNGEKSLIFTQFRKMGDLILKILERKFDFPILYFHGGVPEKKRRVIVDEFQSLEPDSSPILILSLKAGGTGLNLTQGTTVIHFDRWWNPAVENQATDRAYRIGQTSRVNVYKFITIGTIEEKIDALLEEKQDLADKIVVSSGESWVSDFNDEKLKELFTLTE
ncbi:MAG: SNF2-related protein [Promethearchaeota archaeon]